MYMIKSNHFQQVDYNTAEFDQITYIYTYYSLNFLRLLNKLFVISYGHKLLYNTFIIYTCITKVECISCALNLDSLLSKV